MFLNIRHYEKLPSWQIDKYFLCETFAWFGKRVAFVFHSHGDLVQGLGIKQTLWNQGSQSVNLFGWLFKSLDYMKFV